MPVSSTTRVDLGPSHGVRMRRASVPMRDGVSLNAAVYTPRSGERVPAVMELTPYTVDSAHGEGQYFPSRGFAYVVADVRGRGTGGGLDRGAAASEGEDCGEGAGDREAAGAAQCHGATPTGGW
jgi:predicted acyl esterase